MRYMPLLPYPRIWQESHILGGGPQPPHEPRDVLHRRLVDRYAQRLKELQPQLQARRIRAQRRRGPVQRLQVRKEGLHLTHRLAAPVEHRPRLRLVRHQHPLHPHPDLPHAVHHEHHRSQLRQSYPTRSAREHARRLPTRPSGRADEHEGHTGHDQENASTTALSTQRSDVEDTPRGLQRRSLRGYSADRTMIAAWTCGSRGPATTTRGRPGSSNPGSRPTPTAWTTWSGCAGRTASCALAATTPVGGRSVMAGTSAPAAGRVP